MVSQHKIMQKNVSRFALQYLALLCFTWNIILYFNFKTVLCFTWNI